MKKRNSIWALFLCFSLSIGLAGCNSQNTAGSTADNASGTGIEGSATGSAVEEAGQTDFDSRYQFCNDWHLYTEEDNGFTQRTLQGEEQKVIHVKSRKNAEPQLCMVSNQEIFYCYTIDEITGELWSIPLEAESHQPQEEKAQKLLTLKGGLDNYGIHINVEKGMYADSQYIAFVDMSDTYVEYDRQSGERISVDNLGEGKERSYQLINKKIASDTVWLFSNSITYQDGTIEEVKGYTYWHVVGSGEVQKKERNEVAEAYKAKNLISTPSAYAGKYMYYNNEFTEDIYVLDTDTGEQRKFLAEKQLKELCEEEGIGEFAGIWDLVTSEKRLYMYLYAQNNPGDNQWFAFSCPLENAENLVYESELSQLLQDTTYAENTVVVGDTLLFDMHMWFEDGTRRYVIMCCHLDTKECKKEITEKDPEWWLWQYDVQW